MGGPIKQLLLARSANQYSAADNGKVVVDGALVEQTEETVIGGGIYDTTTIKKLTVNDAGEIDAMFAKVLDDENTQAAFETWWPLSNDGSNRYARLARWFALMAAENNHTYTLRWYQESVSDSSDMTPLDDLAAKSAGALVTEQSSDTPDWTELDRMLWYVRANAESLADGTMAVLAVEGVDETFDVTGELAPVYTFSAALWIKRSSDDDYLYKSWRAKSETDYVPYAGDVAPDGSKREMTWHPTFSGGVDANNKLTSGSGKAAWNFHSASDGLTRARARNAYEGLWCDCDSQWLLDMWQLRHFSLENSAILEGCTSYDVDHTVAKAESGATRVLVSQADGADYLVGSTVSVTTATARADASTGVALMKKITSKADVEIDGTTYTALNLDISGTITTTTAMHVFSMPWHTGSTEVLQGHKDGSLYSLTDGKTPARVAGVEVLTGAYNIGLDPLYNVTGSGGSYSYAVYECKNSEKLATSITSNYANTNIAKTGVASGWNYVREFAQTALGVLFPLTFGGGDTIRYKSSFLGPYSAGVRCPWRFGSLTTAGAAGLACEVGDHAPSHSFWFGVPRLAGSGKKRGEWTTA